MSRPRMHSDEDLVAAAARTIARRGPHETTLADVAARAGVAPATLVQRFGSKRGMLLAVAAAGPSVISDAFAEARARRRSPLQALEDVLARLAGTVSDPDEVANHLAFLALDLGDPEFRAHARRDTASLRDGIDALLREASSAGELRLRSRADVTELIQAAYHGALLMWAIDREGNAPARVRRHVRLVLRPYLAGRAGR